LTKVEQNKARLATALPQFGSRLPKQRHIPPDTGLQRHNPTRLLLSHRSKPTNTILRGVSHNFFLHLFCLHVPTVHPFHKIIFNIKTFEKFKATIKHSKVCRKYSLTIDGLIWKYIREKQQSLNIISSRNFDLFLYFSDFFG